MFYKLSIPPAKHSSNVDKEPSFVLSVTDDKALGTYTGFPTFEGEVKWNDDSNIEISIYKVDTPNDNIKSIKPLEIKKIKI